MIECVGTVFKYTASVNGSDRHSTNIFKVPNNSPFIAFFQITQQEESKGTAVKMSFVLLLTLPITVMKLVEWKPWGLKGYWRYIQQLNNLKQKIDSFISFLEILCKNYYFKEQSLCIRIKLIFISCNVIFCRMAEIPSSIKIMYPQVWTSKYLLLSNIYYDFLKTLTVSWSEIDIWPVKTVMQMDFIPLLRSSSSFTKTILLHKKACLIYVLKINPSKCCPF